MNDLMERMALGALAGLAGTALLQKVRTQTQELLPGATPEIKPEPGAFMVEQAEELLPGDMAEQVPDSAEHLASKLLAVGYGMTFGALYAAIRPNGGLPLRDGPLLGVIAWSVGYLGWLPAAGLMKPLTQQEPEQALTPIAQHVIFGVATVAPYRVVRALTH